GCPLGTLRSRLDRGRAQLRARLARRGLALAAALPAALLPGTGLSATPPRLLTASTVRAALRVALGEAAAAGAVSGHALAPAGAAARSTASARLKIGAPLLLAAGVFAAGAGLCALQARPASPAAARLGEGKHTPPRTPKEAPRPRAEGAAGR